MLIAILVLSAMSCAGFASLLGTVLISFADDCKRQREKDREKAKEREKAAEECNAIKQKSNSSQE